ncbi:hypothetical protein EDD55_104175 [Varunaivibrio sulfuroxidans]|uniref:Uncharacterized protein n=1 Tax=Varunaivibrio sulfuroxidans TaxID=1773489 RepID=A0A4R3JBJ8_9PROT|nr:hypothetical protein EDD55_104175 [Varunaivibrio sulfuroxidans]
MGFYLIFIPLNDTIARTGRRPSLLARVFKTNRIHTLVMLTPNATNPFFAEVPRGVEDACYAHGDSLILCRHFKLEALTAPLRGIVSMRVWHTVWRNGGA